MEKLEDKVCPFSMGKPYEARTCQGDKCMAWGERIERYIDSYNELRYQSNEGCRLIP